MYNQIQGAIQDSIRENQIVRLTAKLDTSEWVDMVNTLAVECDDWIEASGQPGPNDELVREYWGTDDDGDEWRIHVYGER